MLTEFIQLCLESSSNNLLMIMMIIIGIWVQNWEGFLKVTAEVSLQFLYTGLGRKI
jgi:hypothetical protein